MPRRCRASSSVALSAARPCNRARNCSASITVRSSFNALAWPMNTSVRVNAGALRTGVSPHSTRPDSGAARPAARRSRLVLPRPLRPRSQVARPLRTSRLTPLNNRRLPRRHATSTTDNMGSGSASMGFAGAAAAMLTWDDSFAVTLGVGSCRGRRGARPCPRRGIVGEGCGGYAAPCWRLPSTVSAATPARCPAVVAAGRVVQTVEPSRRWSGRPASGRVASATSGLARARHRAAAAATAGGRSPC